VVGQGPGQVRAGQRKEAHQVQREAFGLHHGRRGEGRVQVAGVARGDQHLRQAVGGEALHRHQLQARSRA